MGIFGGGGTAPTQLSPAKAIERDEGVDPENIQLGDLTDEEDAEVIKGRRSLLRPVAADTLTLD